jgi:hypothetical protein
MIDLMICDPLFCLLRVRLDSGFMACCALVSWRSQSGVARSRLADLPTADWLHGGHVPSPFLLTCYLTLVYREYKYYSPYRALKI